MGISRDSRHKRRLTGGKMPIHKKKRVFERGRPMAHTKLGPKKIRKMRVRGGNYKFRALRLNVGNYNWQSEGVALKTKIMNVVYNSSNNELVRTNTLVKNTIVRIDATPFRNFLVKHYFGLSDQENEKFELDFEKWGDDAESGNTKNKQYLERRKAYKIEPRLIEQIQKGNVLACISSRPGQSGRADGYLLEGKELEFYLKKMERK